MARIAAPRKPTHPGQDRVPGYGPAPGIRDGIVALAADVADLADSVDPSSLPARIAQRLPETLAVEDLLAPQHREGGVASYQRHILYADPLRRFTILALIWNPGQATPVHGHTAWGAVGVYAGHPTVTLYERKQRSDQLFEICCSRTLQVRPGDVCFVQPGIDDVHRISNETDDPAISIHVYGRDLLQDPASINIILTH